MAEDDVVFQEAVEALREGKKARARELLTGLLKTNQNNATYWIWMSATVDSTKERIYCLQTALKLDPENATAKRGLILHGALPADESVQPFPVNRPRAWEEKLLLAHEKPRLKGWSAVHYTDEYAGTFSHLDVDSNLDQRHRTASAGEHVRPALRIITRALYGD